MKPPRTYEALLAFLLLMMGAIFSLLGLVFQALSIPMRNGDASSFLLGGLPLLVFGGGLLLWARRKEHSWDRLRAEGRAVPGKLVPEATRRHWYTSFGSDGIRKRSPWTMLCIYQWEGKTYDLRSEFLWRKPQEGEQHPTIYLDPLDPKRAWVDPDSLQYEITLR